MLHPFAAALALSVLGPPPAQSMSAADACRPGISDALSRCRRPAVVQAAARSSAWKFSRVQGNKEGESSAAIIKTAETLQSDADFAGLIIRCAPNGKVDALVAIIRPLPPRSHPHVTIGSGNGENQTFEASMTAAGSAVLLPREISAFAGGKWQAMPSLSIGVSENDRQIKGVVSLDGLSDAYNSLLPSCGQ